MLTISEELGIENLGQHETSISKNVEGEYYLLPIAIELANAPVPGEWSEVMELYTKAGGLPESLTLLFREESTGRLQLEHPLTGMFRALLERERRRHATVTGTGGDATHWKVPLPAVTRTGRGRYLPLAALQGAVTFCYTPTANLPTHAPHSKGPHWLLETAQRYVQFATHVGGVYFYDFATSGFNDSLANIVLLAHQAYVDDGGVEEHERRSSVVRLPPEKQMSPADAAKAATKAAEKEHIRKQSVRVSQAKALATLTEGSSIQQIMKAQLAAEREAEVTERFHEALKRTFTPVLSTSLAHEPRPLKTTIEVAVAYGIDIVHEAEYLWLADLALSLPTPIGWIHLTQGIPPVAYWHNELLGISQWNHPIDEFIKCTLKALRQPMQPICLPQLQALLGPQFNPLESRGA